MTKWDYIIPYTCVMILAVIIGIIVAYQIGKDDGKQELIDEIKEECQYAPSPVEHLDTTYIFRYYPLNSK
jgi:hypothetical protein